VLTLVTHAEQCVTGAIYWVSAPAESLLRELDHRERAGYERSSIEVTTESGSTPAVTWLAKPGNAYDAGDLELPLLAAHIAASVGPSGRNDDYVFRLKSALDELAAEDSLVSALAALLRR
jgi:cation transport regulator ChaC